MISEDEFTYTTMFGNTRTYSFYDVEKLRYNKDSLTLFVAGDKVHMEDMAIISDRLEKAIKRALAPGYKYLKFTAEELEKLPDEELFIAVWARVDDVVMQKESIAEGIGVLNEAQRLFYSLSNFECDVNLEGLSGFFEDSIRIAAPFIGEYLGTVGAVEHRQLYEDFIKNNKINTELFSYQDREEEIESHLEGCPFEDYDNAYRRLSPIRDYLHDYIRENIDQF